MSAPEKTTSQAQGPPDHDEFAGAKLWAVYISEAENYDKALVESWKSDMEGLLIFAGLFSASLTAFLIESYKTLNANQGTITIAVLTQISLQLDPRSNASAVNISSLEAFTPTPASLACNVLWFLSLWASLSCALIATLVQQWARDFIQRTEMRPSPIVRARIFSYLYFGLRRFGMHKAVEFIPLLLHVSLLLFFAGLVAFLIPVHRALTIMTAVLLFLIAAAYAYLTVLPIFSSDSPYRTPLSNLVWGSFRRFAALWHLPRQSSESLDEESTLTDERSPIPAKTIPTMLEIMTHDAIEKSNKRDERDARAIVWTVQSLTDDNELEPFVEALPDLIWGPTGRRTGHDDMIKLLLGTRELQLVSRIEGLLRSCDTGFLPQDREARRRIACIKALWGIAHFVVAYVPKPQSFPVFDQKFLASQLKSGTKVAVVKSHMTSTYSLVRWSAFCSVSALIREALTVFENPDNTTPAPGPLVLLKMLQHQADKHLYTELSGVLANLRAHHPIAVPALIQGLRGALLSFEDTASDILAEYLLHCASLEDEPYEFEATCAMMVQGIPMPPNSQVQIKLRDAFIRIIGQHQSTLTNHLTFHHIDRIVDIILHLLQPSAEYFDPRFAGTFVDYLTYRDIPSEAITQALGRCNPKWIGSLLTKYLTCRPASPQHIEPAIYEIWRLSRHADSGLADFGEETLAAVSAVPRFLCSSCVVAVLKTRILVAAVDLPLDQLDALMHRLQITVPASRTSRPSTSVDRWKQGSFVILVEFLEQSTSLAIPDPWNTHRVVDTFTFLVDSRSWDRASKSLQRRLATWFLDVVHNPAMTELIDAIVDWENRFLLESLDDQNARMTVCDALSAYASFLRGSNMDDESMRSIWRINNLLVFLNSSRRATDPEWHETTNGPTNSNR
ncbi:hypothetical protein C8R44DRAFT_774141 [Mycena epipterygia]|nr:hypothetical protein C8R44DRAFT_774141 [Mycena epipterygia]